MCKREKETDQEVVLSTVLDVNVFDKNIWKYKYQSFLYEHSPMFEKKLHMWMMSQG